MDIFVTIVAQFFLLQVNVKVGISFLNHVGGGGVFPRSY